MNNKTVNKQISYFFLLFAVCAVFISAQAFAKSYIESAQNYLSENNRPAAIIELKNAIQQSPDDPVARRLLGEIYSLQGQTVLAEKELSKAVSVDPSDVKSLTLLAWAQLQQNKLDDVILLIEDYLSHSNTPNDELQAISAIAKIRQGDLDKGAAALDGISLEGVYAQIAQATLLSANGDFEQSYQIAEDLVATHPDNSDVWVLKGHLESSMQQFGESYQSFLKASELAPESLTNAFFTAKSLVNERRFDQALPILDKLLMRNRNAVPVNELKAIIAFQDQDFKVAKVHAERAINNGSDSDNIAVISAISSFNLGQYEQAHKAFLQLPPNVENRKFIHRIYTLTKLRLGHIDEVINSLEKLEIETKEDSQFISQASVELAKKGRYEAALRLAKRADVNGVSEIKAAIGLIKLANNDITGIDELEAALQSSPDIRGAKLALINYYLTENMLDEADAVSNEWLRARPDDADALILKGVLSMKSGDYDSARKLFEQVKTIDPKNVQPYIELAEIELLSGNEKLALSEIHKAKQMAPDDHIVNKRFLEFSHKLKKMDFAVETLDEQIAADPTNVNVKVQKAVALALDNRLDDAIELLETLPNTAKNAITFALLGKLYLAAGNDAQAEVYFDEWQNVSPYNPSAYFHSLALSQSQRNTEKSLKTLNMAQSFLPEDQRFILAKVQALLDLKRVGLAQREMKKLDTEALSSPAGLQLQARIHIADKNYAEAVNLLKTRFAKVDDIASALELASVYQLNDQNDDAIQFLNEVIAQKEPSEIEPLMLKLATLQADENEAIAQYLQVLKSSPDNVIALNNVASLYMNQGKSETACDYAKRAYELASRSYQVTDTYGYCLLKTGDVEQALQLLESAYLSKKDDAEIALNYAEGLVSDNEYKKALEVLSGITTKSAKSEERKQSLQNQIGQATQ